ncbi:hypothetical protein JX265_013820 [Neoarthrinium moseri]|uniref:Uncharacterized protein n=1 Tax=Neoarthrinium moseri TaxID=1658444 RepID=A0A9P9W7Y3_9PEZI|nr:hypothetical protein JX265_013820 [Neoarthrinium moseri]
MTRTQLGPTYPLSASTHSAWSSGSGPWGPGVGPLPSGFSHFQPDASKPGTLPKGAPIGAAAQGSRLPASPLSNFRNSDPKDFGSPRTSGAAFNDALPSSASDSGPAAGSADVWDTPPAGLPVNGPVVSNDGSSISFAGSSADINAAPGSAGASEADKSSFGFEPAPPTGTPTGPGGAGEVPAKSPPEAGSARGNASALSVSSASVVPSGPADGSLQSADSTTTTYLVQPSLSTAKASSVQISYVFAIIPILVVMAW